MAKKIRVDFISLIRREKKFSNPEELKKQLTEDKKNVLKLI